MNLLSGYSSVATGGIRDIVEHYAHRRKQQVALQNKFSFGVPELKSSDYSATKVLSLLNDDVLIGCLEEQSEHCHANGWLYIHHVWSGDCKNAVKTPGPVHSALLARTGNIVCTVSKTDAVYVLSPITGEVLATTPLEKPQLLCVSEAGVIYLSSLACVYQSADGGHTWQLRFRTPDGSIVLKMIHVGDNDNGDSVFWAATIIPEPDSEDADYQFWIGYSCNDAALHEYVVGKDSVVSSEDFVLIIPAHVNAPVDKEPYELPLSEVHWAYDGNGSVLVANDFRKPMYNGVYQFAVAGRQFKRLLLDDIECPSSLVINRQRKLICVADCEQEEEVNIFHLKEWVVSDVAGL